MTITVVSATRSFVASYRPTGASGVHGVAERQVDNQLTEITSASSL